MFLRKVCTMVCWILLFSLSLTTAVQAIQGDNGYDGGISAGGMPGQDTYDYQEVVFITGQPIQFVGKLTITRSLKTDRETVTYRYNLSHGQRDRLTRTMILDIQVKKKNNQIVREAVLKSRPVETITIEGETYTLDRDSNVDFSLSTITDDRPAADYFAGNWDGKKVYSGRNSERITVTTTGTLYGYDQYWGNTEVKECRQYIEAKINNGERQDSWGGTVELRISSTMAQRLLYIDNLPHEISFEGGYLQRQESNSILSYAARLPEFDADGLSTDHMLNYKDELSQQSFPVQKRLIVPDLKKIKGHWYENDVKQLYSLEVYDGDPNEFQPNQYMTRAEFAKAVVQAGKIPVEEDVTTGRINPRQRTNTPKEQEISPYVDVPKNHPYYKYVYALYKNGAMAGVGQDRFNPDDIITRAQALTIFIRMLGFESIAPNPAAITYFRDNDFIPDWARSSVAVASYINLVRGDDYGYLNPNQPMTKAEASAFLNRLINYMRHDIVRDYRDRVFIY